MRRSTQLKKLIRERRVLREYLWNLMRGGNAEAFKRFRREGFMKGIA